MCLKHCFVNALSAYGSRIGKTALLMLATPMLLFGVQATAFAQEHDFKLGDTGIEGEWSTRVTVGTSVRTRGQNKALIGRAFGNDGKPKGGVSQSNGSDDGDANYPSIGKPYSSPVMVYSDLRLKYGNYGAYVSGDAWYDYSLENQNVPIGNIPNGMRNAPLSDDGFNNNNRFATVRLLNAYAYGKWNLGDAAIEVRAGKQTVNWGNTLFYQGVNYVNPVDFAAIHRPGADPRKEGQIPTEMLYGKLDIDKNLSVDGFYQLKWRPSNLDACGTFFSTLDFGIDPSCHGISFDTFYGPLTAVEMPASAANWFNDGFGLYMERTPTINAHDSGQYGIALHWSFAPLQSKVDLYWMDVGSRMPMLSLTNWDPAALATPNAALLAAGAPANIAALASGLGTMRINWSYPNHVKVMGLSYSGNLHGWGIGGEVSHVQGLPVQLNAADLLFAVLQHTGPLASRIEYTAPLTPFRGYDRLNKTQLVLNAKRGFRNILGADSGSFAGEVLLSHADNLPPLSSARYGRGFQYGFAADGYTTCAQASDPNLGILAACRNAGFATRFSWGYRLRWQLDYSGPHGMTWSPVIMWAHDVKGNSIDGQLLDQRKIATFGLKVDYRKKYFGELTYSTRFGGATYDSLGDRDYLMAVMGINF